MRLMLFLLITILTVVAIGCEKAQDDFQEITQPALQLQPPNYIPNTSEGVFYTSTGTATIFFEWTSAEGAIGYQFTIKDYSDYNVIDTTIKAPSNPTINPSITVDLIPRSNPYRWIVQPINDFQSYPGDIREFYVQYEAPQLYTPANYEYVCIDNQTFLWQELKGVKQYQITLYEAELEESNTPDEDPTTTAATATSATDSTASTAGTSATTNDAEVDYTGKIAGYKHHLTAIVNIEDYPSPLVDFEGLKLVKYTVPLYEPLLIEDPVTHEQVPAFEQAVDAEGNPLFKEVNGKQEPVLIPVPDPTKPYEFKLEEGLYAWEITPFESGKKAGRVSERWHAIVIEKPKPNPLVVLSSPEQSYSGQQEPIILTWDPSTPDIGYEVEIYADSTETKENLERYEVINPGATREVRINLNPPITTTYYWRVRSAQRFPCGESDWSEFKEFRVFVCDELVLSPLNPEDLCPGQDSIVSYEIPPDYQDNTIEFSYDGVNWDQITEMDEDKGYGRMESPFGYSIKTLNFGPGCNAAGMTPVYLADNGTTVEKTEISEDFIVEKVTLEVDIEHSWNSDLQIKVVNPNGIDVQLTDHRGVSGNDYDQTVFDDDADIAIKDSHPPFKGRLRPDEPLNVFKGTRAKGVWTVLVCDLALGDHGELKSWCLHVTGRIKSKADSGFLRMTAEDVCGSKKTSAPEFFSMIPSTQLSADLSCVESGALAFKRKAGYTYTVEFFDPSKASSGTGWFPIAVNDPSICRLDDDDPDLTICRYGGDPSDPGSGIGPGKGGGYQWKIASMSPEGCADGPIFTQTFSWWPNSVEWVGGLGYFIKSDICLLYENEVYCHISNMFNQPCPNKDAEGNPLGGGNGNDWEIENMCPDDQYWAGGWKTGNKFVDIKIGGTICSNDITLRTSTDSKAMGIAPPGANQGNIGPDWMMAPCGPSKVAWFTATKAFWISTDYVDAKISVKGGQDAMHFQIYDISRFGTMLPPPGIPSSQELTDTSSACKEGVINTTLNTADQIAVVARQFCIGLFDGFGCGSAAQPEMQTNLSPFTLAGYTTNEYGKDESHCYVLRLTSVDSTGGTWMLFDIDFGEKTTIEQAEKDATGF